ncbi:MAG: hypothetical protein ACKOC0_07730, partial [Cytophagales bacterium]
MNSENRKFEDEWKRAFADAESDVNDAVWVNINSKLANAENGAMKKRVVFYQWLAAASAVFALMVGGALMLGRSDKNQTSLSQQVEKKQRAADSMQDSSKNKIANAQLKKDFPPTSTSNPVELKKTNPSALNNQPATGLNKQTDANRKIEPSIAHSITGITRNKGSVAKFDHTKNKSDSQRLSSENSPSTTIVADVTEMEKETTTVVNVNKATETETPIASNAIVITPIENLLLATDTTAALIDSPVKISSKETPTEVKDNTGTREVTAEKWWASLTGSAGSYTSIGGSGTLPNSALYATSTNANNTPNSSNEKVGTSFSYGINVGKQIAPRWVIMSGVGYMTQSINYPSSSAVFSSNQAQAFIADLSRASASPTVSVASYELTSVNEFVTIPLQAGYLLVNRKVGVQLNAGVASDLFLRNTLSDPAGRLSTSSQSAGDASTYKTVNWSGLVGTELSYKISTHYRISVIPGMRYSFDSILKSNVNGSITPLIWDVGFR